MNNDESTPTERRLAIEMTLTDIKINRAVLEDALDHEFGLFKLHDAAAEKVAILTARNRELQRALEELTRETQTKTP